MLTSGVRLTDGTIVIAGLGGTVLVSTDGGRSFTYSQQTIAPTLVDVAPGVRARLSGYDVQGADASTEAP